eukprot:973247-Amphidinium_carterae.1
MATRYPPLVWMMVYQADVRMRLENFESIRRAEVLKAAMGGKSLMFVEARPWNFVFRQATRDETAEDSRHKAPTIGVMPGSSTCLNQCRSREQHQLEQPRHVHSRLELRSMTLVR